MINFAFFFQLSAVKQVFDICILLVACHVDLSSVSE